MEGMQRSPKQLLLWLTLATSAMVEIFLLCMVLCRFPVTDRELAYAVVEWTKNPSTLNQTRLIAETTRVRKQNVLRDGCILLMACANGFVIFRLTGKIAKPPGKNVNS